MKTWTSNTVGYYHLIWVFKKGVNHNQINEINEILDRGEELDKEIKDQLDQDFKTILGEQDYNDFNQEILELQDQFSQQLQDIFTKLF